MTDALEKKVKGYECKNVTYCPSPGEGAPDLHFVKEVVHYEDGTWAPTVRGVKDFKRDFYITKPNFQNHEQKKEGEKLDRVQKFSCPQRELARRINQALPFHQRSKRDDLRMLSRSQYLYGSDILSTAVLKKTYQDKYPDLQSTYKVAVYDTEADVVNGTDQIIMATLSFGNRVYTAVQKEWLEGLTDVYDRAQEAIVKYLSDMDAKDKDGNPTKVNILKKRGIEWTLEIVADEFEVVNQTMRRAHEWRPDFVAIWNIDYDIPKSLAACDRVGVRYEDVFCDPNVPPEYRYFNYKQGPRSQLTASGVYKSLAWFEQWHTVQCPASFYFLDAGCVYYRQRVAKGKPASMALDAILDKELGMRKLKFAEADGLSKIDWHIFMQSKYKIEYIIYNVFDCVSMEELDEKTTDLQLAMPSACGFSDFANYKSQPRRTCDKLHYFYLTKGEVFGSTSDQMKIDLDEVTVSPKDWIVMLPSHLVADNGLCLIEEDETWRTNIRVHVADLDVSASYPNGGAVFNMSKKTTRRELCKIKGVPEIQQRMQGINLSAGHVNAVEICCHLFGMPDMETMLDAFNAHLENPTAEARLETKEKEQA